MWKPDPPRVLVWLAAAAWGIYTFLAAVVVDGADDYFGLAIGSLVGVCFLSGLLFRRLTDVALVVTEMFAVIGLAAVFSVALGTLTGAYAEAGLNADLSGMIMAAVLLAELLTGTALALFFGAVISKGARYAWSRAMRRRDVATAPEEGV